MKRKFAKILGVGLTLALLTSLMVIAVPVLANVTQPQVSFPSPGEAVISRGNADYQIRFELGVELIGSQTGTISLPDPGDAATITGGGAIDSGTVTVTAGSISATVTGGGAIGSATITPASGAVAWSVTAGASTVVLTATAGVDGTAATWTSKSTVSGTSIVGGTATCAMSADLNQNITGTGALGAITLPDVGDTITVSGTAADVVTMTLLVGTITVTPTGTGTWTPVAGGGTATLVAATDTFIIAATSRNVGFTLAGAVTTTTAITTEVNEAVAVGAPVADGDTITITFPADTAVAAGDSTTTYSTATIQNGPGWIGGSWLNGSVASVDFLGTAAPARTVVATLHSGDAIGEGAQVRIALPDGITNPSAVDSYYLTVKTSKETTEVTSAAYSITAPVVGALEGIVKVYNPAGVLMTQDTGDSAISDCIDQVSAPGYTVEVGPGRYDNEVGLDCNGQTGLTIVATGTPEETIVIANWALDQDGATLDGFNIQGKVTSSAGSLTWGGVTIQNCSFTHTSPVPASMNYINVTGGLLTVQDNTFECDAGAVQDTAIIVDGGTVTIMGNSFSLDETLGLVDDRGILVNSGDNVVKVTGCTFTGASGIGYISSANSTDTITENTFDGLQTAVLVEDANSKTTVRGNAIQNGTVSPLATAVTAEAQIDINAAASVLIDGNDIANCAGYSVDVANGVANVVTVAGNYFSGNTYGLTLRETGTQKLNAQLNDWGAASGPTIASNLAGTGDAINEIVVGSVLYRPWATVGTSEIATASITDAAGGTIDQSIIVGISFTSNKAVGSITLARYISNPAISDPPYVALANAYYDVFVPGAGITGEVDTILFYNAAIDRNTSAYYYSTLQQSWWPCSTVAVAGNNAYVIVTVSATTSPTAAELAGTPFVLVNLPPSPRVTITSPDIGAYDIPVSPMFTWDAVVGALRYELTLSEDPTFAIIEWSYNVDDNFYKATDDLRYSTTYYWRVRALTGEPYQVGPAWVTPSGPWSTGIFTTMAEPAPPAEEGPTEITVETPEVTVTPGAVNVDVAPVVPDYLLWTIVGIGAVLIIALIVLIVRTRRVA